MYAKEYPENWKKICESINSQQPLKNSAHNRVYTSYEGERGLSKSALTNGETESSPALDKHNPADTNNFKQLEDKKIPSCLNDSSEAKYRESSIKEFLQRLKKLVNAHTIIAHDKDFNEWREIDMAYGHFVQEIDKLAGQSLIGDTR